MGVPPGICYGRGDVMLRPGWEGGIPDLARRAGRSRPSMLWSSPASRCLLPARALAALLRVPVQVDPDLVELDFGVWDGTAWDAVPRALLDLWAADPLDFAPPGGESGRSLLSRVGGFASRLRDARRNAVVMAHGGPLRVLPALLRGEPPDLFAPAPAMGTLQTLTLS